MNRLHVKMDKINNSLVGFIDTLSTLFINSACDTCSTLIRWISIQFAARSSSFKKKKLEALHELVFCVDYIYLGKKWWNLSSLTWRFTFSDWNQVWPGLCTAQVTFLKQTPGASLIWPTETCQLHVQKSQKKKRTEVSTVVSTPSCLTIVIRLQRRYHQILYIHQCTFFYRER
jgi:hypothetical protein